MNIKPDPSLPWPVDYEDGVVYGGAHVTAYGDIQ